MAEIQNIPSADLLRRARIPSADLIRPGRADYSAALEAWSAVREQSERLEKRLDSWLAKGEGEPCVQGETSAQTGCVPQEGEARKKPGEGEEVEGSEGLTPPDKEAGGTDMKLGDDGRAPPFRNFKKNPNAAHTLPWTNSVGARKKAEKKKVKLAELVASQNAVSSEAVGDLVDHPEQIKGEGDLPLVADIDGNLFIVDGHTRLAAAKLTGEEEVEVDVWVPDEEQSAPDWFKDHEISPKEELLDPMEADDPREAALPSGEAGQEVQEESSPESRASRILKAAVPKKVRAFVAKIKDAALQKLYDRYGERTAKLIISAAALSVAIPIPGTQPATIAASLIVAEALRAIRKIRGEKSMNEFRGAGLYRISWSKGSERKTVDRWFRSSEDMEAILGGWKGEGYSIDSIVYVGASRSAIDVGKRPRKAVKAVGSPSEKDDESTAKANGYESYKKKVGHNPYRGDRLRRAWAEGFTDAFNDEGRERLSGKSMPEQELTEEQVKAAAEEWVGELTGEAERVLGVEWENPSPGPSPFRDRKFLGGIKGLNEDRVVALGEWLAEHKDPAPMPGYGQIFVQYDSGRVWYVGGDGDDEDFGDLVEEKLGSVPGVREVTREAEGFPPKDQGWVQVHPKKRKWIKHLPCLAGPDCDKYPLIKKKRNKSPDEGKDLSASSELAGGAFVPPKAKFGPVPKAKPIPGSCLFCIDGVMD